MYMENQELIKGTLSIIILRLLDKNERMYGYEITQRVKELTAQKLTLNESALYPALHKLEAEGFLMAEEEFIGKRVRKYYKLTQSGKEEAINRIKEFEAFFEMIQNIVQFKIAFE